MMNSPISMPYLRDRAGAIVATGTILAILYFARDVLIPITLALLLSLLLSPLVRVLRRLGFGSTPSVLAAVLTLVLSCSIAAALMGVQVTRIATSLPQYEQTIHNKLQTLNELIGDRLTAFTGHAQRIMGAGAEHWAAENSTRTLRQPNPHETARPMPVEPIPVELHQPSASPLQVIERVLATVWGPLSTTGIVLVVLVFVLLEKEAVRDRFIRFAGGSDLRESTLALNDAGERLSRFFVSQFAVNLGVGVALWIGLAIIGLPHAVLWAALAAALRFVPYIGVWIAALFSTVVAAAVDPGWTLAFMILGLFLCIELIAGQLVEPQLFGHSTGLSPLSVVIAAIFWSWLWGPVGLIVSTPLTLCLVVAGRHIKALSFFDILLGDTHALTMPERFYQRALSADSEELIARSRVFLKHNSLAAYCDAVLMPALRLAALDLERGVISGEQQLKVRNSVVAVISAIGGESRRFKRRRDAISVLDQMSAGRQLRQQREQLTGRGQDPVIVPLGSAVLCVSLGSIFDDLATELLVRILGDKKLDARHRSLDELVQVPPPDASPGNISMAYLVSALPGESRKRADTAAEHIRRRFPGACLVTLFLPVKELPPGSAIETLPSADKAASSFGEAVQVCLDWLQERAKT